MSKHSHTDNHCSHAGHTHVVPAFNRAFLIAVVANGMFVLVQIFFSLYANSSSLLADAIHNLGDVLGLILSWIANSLLTRSPTAKTTYGLKKISILAALVNGMMLVFTCGIIATDAIYKLFSPSPILAIPIMMVAALGIFVNSATAFLFMRGTDDLNIRSAFLHLLYDALISVGVVCSAGLLYFTHWLWLDPMVGLIIAGIIMRGTWSLFKDSFRLIIDGVPRDISSNAVYELLRNQHGVEQVHDLHIWALSTKENALSVHLFMPNIEFTDQSREQLTTILKAKHNIQHITIQIEKDLSFCKDACKN